jgi:hypothetical protein
VVIDGQGKTQYTKEINMNKHAYVGSGSNCTHKDEDVICGHRKNHLIHKLPKIRPYKEGEVVGDRYVADKNGSLRKVKR